MIVTKKIKTLRVYPVDTIINEQTASLIDRRSAFVTMGLPDGPQVPLDKVVGIIESLTEDEDGGIIGIFKMADTALSKVAEPIMECLELTPVGLGSVIDNVVQPDYRLSCFSLIPTEDTHGRFPDEEPEEGYPETPED